MDIYSARATCNVCGRFSQAIGADKEDAVILLKNDHGNEYKHALEGEIVVVVIDKHHSSR